MPTAADLSHRVPIALGALALLLSCAPAWQADRVLGVTVEWPEGGPRPVRPLARAVCAAAERLPDARLLDGATVRVLETMDEVHSACLSEGAAACWHPDPDDEDGAGVIVVGPPGDGGQFSDEALVHELVHLGLWRWDGDADAGHLRCWARYDAPVEVCR